MQKEVHINYKASYTTEGELSEKTKHIWIVVHGYGQLSRFFVRRFIPLKDNQHYIIAPQGLSKFYLDKQYTKVGATWMTKEDRLADIENQIQYLNAVLNKELSSIELNNIKLHILGFSQGVATVCRWVTQSQVPFESLILWAGSIPPELETKDFSFIPKDKQVVIVQGDRDPLAEFLKFEEQVEKISEAWKKPIQVIFKGGHEVRPDVLSNIYEQYLNI